MLGIRAYRAEMGQLRGSEFDDFSINLTGLLEIGGNHNTPEDYVTIFEYLRENTIWLHDKSRPLWYRFQRAIFCKLKQYAWHSVYRTVLAKFPVCLCRCCVNFTSPDQTLCGMHLQRQLLLGVKLPRAVVLYTLSFLGVECRKMDMLRNKSQNHTEPDSELMLRIFESLEMQK